MASLPLLPQLPASRDARLIVRTLEPHLSDSTGTVPDTGGHLGDRLPATRPPLDGNHVRVIAIPGAQVGAPPIIARGPRLVHPCPRLLPLMLARRVTSATDRLGVNNPGSRSRRSREYPRGIHPSCQRQSTNLCVALGSTARTIIFKCASEVVLVQLIPCDEMDAKLHDPVAQCWTILSVFAVKQLELVPHELPHFHCRTKAISLEVCV